LEPGWPQSQQTGAARRDLRRRRRSIGVPAALDSAAITMFRLVLEEYLTLHQLRERIAEQAARVLGDSPD
jgi:hypothetical protein